MADRPVVQPPLDRYVVLDYLAEGGMGAIYLGKKLGAGGFEKEVVLKQLLPEFTAQAEFIDLFLREARLSATLDHANIVHTIDLVNAGDEYFIVMEYVRGGDLRTLLKRAKRRKRRPKPQAAVFIAREVLSALAYAHAKLDGEGHSLGLIHRDVSPSNILVSGTGEVKLTDFGIAKASTHRSIFYRVKGKVGYMSPEQARSETLDSRSDLYSLAVCFYEILTGERLFVTAGLTTSAEDMYKQPIPLVSSKRPGLPKDLDKVMLKALAVARDERYQTAGEFQEALLRVAHRNGLMMTASELAEHMTEVCGKVTDWASATVKEAPREGGTEAYSFGGEPGTGKLGLAELGVDRVGGDGHTGTALLAAGESDSDGDLDDEVDDASGDRSRVEGSDRAAAAADDDDGAYDVIDSADVQSSGLSAVSDVDGAWASAARRRRATSADADRLQGLELTSIIQMSEITHAGARPLVDLSAPPPGSRQTGERPGPPSGDPPGLPTSERDGRTGGERPRPAANRPTAPTSGARARAADPGQRGAPGPAAEPAPSRSAFPATPAAIGTPARGGAAANAAAGKARAPSGGALPTARVDRLPAVEGRSHRRGLSWLPVALLLVLGVVIAYAIAMSGPELSPTTPKRPPSPAPLKTP
jgi:serine/threonine-protein kinase